MENFIKCKVKNCKGNAHFKKNGKNNYCCKHYSQIYRYNKIIDEQLKKEKKDRLNRKCKVKNCENSAFWKNGGALGYCAKHWQQNHKYGKIMDEQRKKEKEKMINKKCKVKNCNGSAYHKNNGSHGYCNKHSVQMRKYGKIYKTRFELNEIIDCGDYYEICLYSGFGEQKEVARAKIDKNDLDKVKNYKWCLNGHNYVITTINHKAQFLHHLILGRKKGFDVDHINHDTLDNRKQNLRFTTRSQNGMNNKSKGYYWDKNRNKWAVEITKNYKKIHLGRFTDEQTAAKVARETRQKYFGGCAYKNN